MISLRIPSVLLALAVLATAGLVSGTSAEAGFFDQFRQDRRTVETQRPQQQPRRHQQERPGFFSQFRQGLQSNESNNPPAAFRRATVRYPTREKPGTIVIDTKSKYLYLVGSNGTAIRYGVGVGREGFGWKGAVKIGRKAEWPGWTPPKQMIARERKRGRTLPAYMPGGPNNPLGARALYLFDGGRDTLYRIHGTNEPWSIGRNVSSGCIRMANNDVIDLYRRAKVGARVVVR